MTNPIQRKVTIDKHGKPVISNLRVPFQRGQLVWVLVSPDKVVVTTSEPARTMRCTTCGIEGENTAPWNMRNEACFCPACALKGVTSLCEEKA